MIDAESFIELLVDKLDVAKFVGVPDSYLSSLIDASIRRGIYQGTYNEGEAVAYATGRTLAGSRTAVIMQNSGLMNAMSPITSLSEMYRIPIVYLIGWRGCAEDGHDEPQHGITGRITRKWIEDIGIQIIEVDKDTTDQDIISMVEGLDGSRSVAVLFHKSSFLKDKKSEEVPEGFTRGYIIRDILEKVSEDVVIVSSTGYNSRELYETEDRPCNFYMFGSMGCAISIGLGIAESLPDRRVIVIDGDGAELMRPQGELLSRSLGVNNLLHIILCNGTYESTGGQDIGDSLELVEEVADLSGGKAMVMHTIEMFDMMLDYFLTNYNPERMTLIFETAPESKSMIRPKESVIELKEKFIESLRED